MASAGGLKRKNYIVGLPLEYLENSDVFNETKFIANGLIQDGSLLTPKAQVSTHAVYFSVLC
ncbi:hypothetical protein J2S16_001733 [Cytobacillus kochii]|nr:hypothetical protein [Cytobacillus kochii]